MSNPRVMLVVLVLIGVLFIAGIGTGSCSNHGTVSTSGGIWPHIQSAIQREMSAKDISALAPGLATLPQNADWLQLAGSPRTLTIGSGDSRFQTRILDLSWVSGPTVHVTYTPSPADKDTAVKVDGEDLSASRPKPLSLSILQAGGELKLSWEGNVAPVIRIGGQPATRP